MPTTRTLQQQASTTHMKTVTLLFGSSSAIMTVLDLVIRTWLHTTMHGPGNTDRMVRYYRRKLRSVSIFFIFRGFYCFFFFFFFSFVSLFIIIFYCCYVLINGRIGSILLYSVLRRFLCMNAWLSLSFCLSDSGVRRSLMSNVDNDVPEYC